jgi:hypothetical protein
VAQEHFEGRGAGSDVEFGRQVIGRERQVEEERKLLADLQTEAALSELVRATDPAHLDQKSFVLWQEKAKRMPGWNPDRQADYLDLWNDVRGGTHEKLSPDLKALQLAWQRMRDGSLDFSEIYGVLEDDSRRDPFLAAFSLLARTLPVEQQATIWENLKKQGGRDIARTGKDLLAGLGDFLLEDDMPAEIVALDPSEGWMNEERERKKVASRNLDAEIERIRDRDYDPVKVLNPDSPVLRALEEGLYALPGTAVSMGIAAIPIGGMGLTYLHVKEAGYRHLRRTLMDGGMTDEDASEIAGLAAPFMAVPDMLLEVAGGKIAAGKIAPVEKAVAMLANRLQGRFARGAGRFAGNWFLEGGIEVGQGLIQPMTHAILAATDGSVPEPVLSNGRDGYFDGFWQQNGATAVTMAPFGFFGALAGKDKRGRTRVYESATDLELRAFGHDAAGVERLRAARLEGRHQFERAVESEQEVRRPLSGDAEEAVKELEASSSALGRAFGEVDASGVWPLIRMHPGGKRWTVHDPESGEEVGTATRIGEAIRIGRAHFDGMAAADAERIGVLATQMEAALGTASRDGSQRQTTVEFLPGVLMDAEEMGRRSALDAERLRAKLVAAEKTGGVDGDFAAQIFGESRTRFEGRQRHTINRIYADGTIATVFHEDFHGFWREARASGRITRDEEISFLRVLDGVMAGKTDKSRRAIRFLPEGIADDAITDMQIDEAMSELAEAEILRTRRRHRDGALEVPPGLVTRHIKALAAANPRVAGKFQAFFEAVRGYFGLALRRAAVLEKGFRDGSLDRAKYDEHLSKVLGLGGHAGDGQVDPSRMEEGWDGAVFSAERNELRRQRNKEKAYEELEEKLAELREQDGSGDDPSIFHEPELSMSDGRPVMIPDELFANLICHMDDPRAYGAVRDWDPFEGHSEALKQAVLLHEGRIAGRAREHGVVLDPDGIPTWQGVGDEGSLPVPAGEARGKTFIHNHPKGSPPGWEDLIEACKQDAGLLRMVSEDEVFSVVLIERNPADYVFLRAFFRKVGDATGTEWMRRQGHADKAAMTKLMQHAVMVELDRRGYLKYQREWR